MDVPFQEYVNVLLRPQSTDVLGSGELKPLLPQETCFHAAMQIWADVSRALRRIWWRVMITNLRTRHFSLVTTLVYRSFCLIHFTHSIEKLPYEDRTTVVLNPVWKQHYVIMFTVQKRIRFQECVFLSSTDTLYFFGDNNFTEWQSLFEHYEPPTYVLPHTTGAYSFGIAGQCSLFLFYVL